MMRYRPTTGDMGLHPAEPAAGGGSSTYDGILPYLGFFYTHSW